MDFAWMIELIVVAYVYTAYGHSYISGTGLRILGQSTVSKVTELATQGA